MQLKKPDNEQSKAKEDRIVLDLRSDDVKEVDSQLDEVLEKSS